MSALMQWARKPLSPAEPFSENDLLTLTISGLWRWVRVRFQSYKDLSFGLARGFTSNRRVTRERRSTIDRFLTRRLSHHLAPHLQSPSRSAFPRLYFSNRHVRDGVGGGRGSVKPDTGLYRLPGQKMIHIPPGNRMCVCECVCVHPGPRIRGREGGVVVRSNGRAAYTGWTDEACMEHATCRQRGGEGLVLGRSKAR